eukprot:CFRG1100T1
MSEKITLHNICLHDDVANKLYTGTIKIVPSGLAWRSADKNEILTWDKPLITGASFRKVGNGHELRLLTTDGFHNFDGFKEEDYSKLKAHFKTHFDLDIENVPIATKGFNWGDLVIKDKFIKFKVDNKSCFDVPASAISQVTLEKSKKQELTLEFKGSDVKHKDEFLAEMRFFYPRAEEEDVKEKTGSDEEEGESRAQMFYKALTGITKQDIKASKAIATFNELSCRTPRGRYEMELYADHVHLHGTKYSYKLYHKAIQRIFLMPKPDLFTVYLAIYVDPPIRQGQTTYPFFIVDLPAPRDGSDEEEKIDVELNMAEEDLAKYDGVLKKTMRGHMFEVLSRILKTLAGKKITSPSANFNSVVNPGTACMSCSLKNETGLLYILENALMFVLKPATYIRFGDVDEVEFDRQGGTTSRTFRLVVETKRSGSHTFSNIAAEEYDNLKNFLIDKNVKIEEAKQADYNYAALGGARDGKDHYAERLKIDGEGSGSESSEDEDFAPGEESEVDEEYASDAGSSSGSDNESGSESDQPKQKNNKSPKPSKSTKKSTPTRKRAKKDPNAPKKPLSTYMMFATENRAAVIAENPDIANTDIVKKMGEQWREMSDADKKPYVDRYAEAKTKYEATLKEYKANKPESEDESQSVAPPKKKKQKIQTKLTSSKPAKNQAPAVDAKFHSAEFIEDSDDMVSE